MCDRSRIGIAESRLLPDARIVRCNGPQRDYPRRLVTQIPLEAVDAGNPLLLQLSHGSSGGVEDFELYGVLGDGGERVVEHRGAAAHEEIGFARLEEHDWSL